MPQDELYLKVSLTIDLNDIFDLRLRLEWVVFCGYRDEVNAFCMSEEHELWEERK